MIGLVMIFFFLHDVFSRGAIWLVCAGMENRMKGTVRRWRTVRFNPEVVPCSLAAAAVASGEAIAANPGFRLPRMHRAHYEAAERQLPPK
jgi:hypothetical protein